MTRVEIIRQLRRPIASLMCASTLCGCVLWGMSSGQHLPEHIVMFFTLIITGDAAARTVEKLGEIRQSDQK